MTGGNFHSFSKVSDSPLAKLQRQGICLPFGAVQGDCESVYPHFCTEIWLSIFGIITSGSRLFVESV